MFAWHTWLESKPRNEYLAQREVLTLCGKGTHAARDFNALAMQGHFYISLQSIQDIRIML
jgi:hypothetical protein